MPNNKNYRGVSSVRAETRSAVDVLNEMKSAFEEFKAENNAAVADLKKGQSDVVRSEKIGRIDASIVDLQRSLDEVNATIAALRVGPGLGAPDPSRKEHSDAFNRFFRRGQDAGLRDLEVKAALTTTSDPDGGYLVPAETETTIDRVLGAASTFRSLARVINIGSNEYKKLVSVGGATSGWVGENEARPVTDTPSLREILIRTGEIYANPAATQTMLDDSRIDIAQWLADEVSVEFAEEEGAAFISGTGDKKPRGLLTYTTVANASYAWGSIGFITTGEAAAFSTTVPFDAMISLYYALKPGYRAGATWLTSDAVMGTVRKFKDGDGNYLWAPPTGPDQPATILGKPVATDDNMPALGANVFPVAFGDFKRAYLIVDRMGIRVLRDPFTNKPNVSFYTTKRVGGGLVNFEAVKLLKCAA